MQAAIRRIAGEVRRDYRGKQPVLIGILKGSFIFMADLVRALEVPLEVEFVTLSSYGKGTTSSGKIRVIQGLHCPIKGRDVLVVEDIVDSGLTVAYFINYLRRKKPASLKLCVLVDKPARRETPVHIDYLGFTVPDRFIVGCGLDCAEKFRNLRDLCALEQKC